MSRRRGGVGIAGALVIVAIVGIWALSHTGDAFTAGTASPPSTISSRPVQIPSGSVADTLSKAGLVTVTGSTDQIDVAAVRALVAKIPAGGAPAANYSRTAYGPPWADTDHNGCDQRNDILARDMTTITFKPGTPDCVVLSGHLADAYTDKTIDFTRGIKTSTAVQIDHLVPLGWAWNHGASGWTETKREELATDFTNLQAVDGPQNESKSDQGPGTWVPPAADYGCMYVTRFAFVTQEYGLSIDSADRTGIDRVLDTCTSK